MRELNAIELAPIAGGVDSKDLGSLAGGYIGWHAGTRLWGYDVAGYNVGSVLSGFGMALAGSVAGRFVAAVSDKYLDPVVDKVVA